ncbi:MAG: PQQ-binding-like beta-propeller repeat protein [Acidobacteria bacterium]|nr:PQQ-binding-like beta-propeller repeat protein [Acidobacteriota bacterium]
MVSPLLLLVLAAVAASANEPDWPQFRGPLANPVGASENLAERWSKTENIEWIADIPGRGWSSPIVAGNHVFLTAVATDGKSKQPQTGTEYSNEYVAELMKQGLTQAQVLEKVTERDIELPKEVTLHYLLYCLDLRTGKTIWKQEFYAGRPPGGRHRKNSFSSETPVTDGKNVYVYIANLGLYAFDRKGKQMWKAALEANPIYLDFGTGSSPGAP